MEPLASKMLGQTYKVVEAKDEEVNDGYRYRIVVPSNSPFPISFWIPDDVIQEIHK